MIDIINATEPQLAALAAACQPASFGLAKKDVVDESYRKALKMDSSEFATQFSPLSSGIMEDIRKALFGSRTTESIKVELYKLNVYGTSFSIPVFPRLTSIIPIPGPGSFFKPHVDTPRSESMVGSLVVVLPTKHEGGSLLFRHGGREFSFDSADAINREGVSQAPFVAFYSDVEHEVSVITAGYRVTLTYNLHLVTPNSSVTTEPAPSDLSATSLNEICEQLKGGLSSLLDNPTFLPNGGFIGFGLVHKYPFTTHTNLSTIEDYLKGTDVAFAQVCQDLGLNFELKAIYTDEDSPNVWALMDKFPRLNFGEVEDGFIEYLTESGYSHQIVFDMCKQQSSEEHPDAQPIFWLKPPTGENEVETPYIRYGNEATLDYAYGDVCLVAHILSKARIQKH